jgi:hypothetical protein
VTVWALHSVTVNLGKSFYNFIRFEVLLVTECKEILSGNVVGEYRTNFYLHS